MSDTVIAMPETSEEIEQLVSEIAAGISEIAKKEAVKAAALRKADGLPPEGEPSPEGDPSASAGAPPSPSADPSASAGGPPPDMGASPDAGAGGPPPGPGGEGGAPGEPAPDGAEGGGSVEELVQLYSQLPDDQLEMHFVAIQQSIQARQGGQPGAEEAPPAGPPGAGAPPPGAGAPPPGAQPLAMSEKDSARMVGLEKSVSLLTQALETVTNAPLRKSVTRYENGIAYIPFQGAVVAPDHKPLKKSMSEMTKQEIHDRLVEVTANPKLEKSDRELINGYYSRSVTVDKLAKFFQ